MNQGGRGSEPVHKARELACNELAERSLAQRTSRVSCSAQDDLEVSQGLAMVPPALKVSMVQMWCRPVAEHMRNANARKQSFFAHPLRTEASMREHVNLHAVQAAFTHPPVHADMPSLRASRLR
eukprot:1227120-Pleurochrysis_carterae.AAC.2